MEREKTGDEPVITPAMLEAGEDALSAYVSSDDVAGRASRHEVVEAVYLAMVHACPK